MTGVCPVNDVGTGDPRIVDALKEWLRQLFPKIAEAAEFEFSWKGVIRRKYH